MVTMSCINGLRLEAEGLRRESQDMDTYHGLNPFRHSPAARSSPSAFGDATEAVVCHD